MDHTYINYIDTNSTGILRIAVIADVHGNSSALSAVLDDIARRNVNVTINLGDNLLGPLDPAGTADMLMGQPLLNVRGNGDRDLIEDTPGTSPSLSCLYTRPLLGERHISWLASLPPTQTVEDIFCCHGTPASDVVSLLEDIGERGASQRDAAEVARQLEGVSGNVVVCGHSHVPRTVQLPDGRLVVNPGSVGLPAYSDDAPYPHVMESGTPHAKYAILSRRYGVWEAEHILVTYDWEQVARLAEEHERPDWAFAIRTGRASAS